MRKIIALGTVMSLAFFLNACSSSKKADESDDLADLPVADAGTDVVPTDTAEMPAAPLTDGATADVAPPTDFGSGGSGTYSVQAGDTLMKIAFEVYGDLYQWRRIYEANRDRILDPNALHAGTQLTVDRPATAPQIDRNGQPYLIKSGDTLGSISGEVYGTRDQWRKLWENNQQLIKDPNKIFAGFTLYYTTGNEPAGSQPLAKPADAPAQQAAPAAMPSDEIGSLPQDDMSRLPAAE